MQLDRCFIEIDGEQLWDSYIGNTYIVANQKKKYTLLIDLSPDTLTYTALRWKILFMIIDFHGYIGIQSIHICYNKINSVQVKPTNTNGCDQSMDWVTNLL
jgi:hypothetical protein